MKPLQRFLVGSALLTACAEGSGSYWEGSSGSPTVPVGGSAGEGAGGVGGGSAGSDTEGGSDAIKIVQPNPIISRGAMVFSSPAGGAAVVNGQYHSGAWSAGAPTPEAPSWVAIQLASGPTRLLVSWDDGGTYNYQDSVTTTVYGLPDAYRIEVSANSTDGSNGDWRTEVPDVTGNRVRTRAHTLSFAGQSWVKLVITAAPLRPNAMGTPVANNVAIGEIDVHDTSATGAGLPQDSWFFMGDSITAFAYDRAPAHQPSFAEGIIAQAIQAEGATFFPAMINGGIGGETSTAGLARLGEALALNPDYRFFVLGYGTNDAANNQIPVATFKTNMQAMIDQVRAAGREPVIPHIPPSADGMHAGIPSYNTAIDELTAENELVAGADLHAYFTEHAAEGLFSADNLHPNDLGLKGMNATWTEAMRPLYP